MPAGLFNFTVEQGATFSREITWRDETNAIVDTTGYTARMHVRDEKNSTTTLLELTTTNGRITLASGAVSPNITLTVTDEDTALLDWDPRKRVPYDLELESSGGVVTRLLEGHVQLSKEVTR